MQRRLADALAVAQGVVSAVQPGITLPDASTVGQVRVADRDGTGALRAAERVRWLGVVLPVLAVVMLGLAIAGYLVYDTVIRPAFLTRETRYLITNKRVLIQRGVEELHVDRTKIVDVIEKGYLLNDKVIRFAKVVVGS